MACRVVRAAGPAAQATEVKPRMMANAEMDRFIAENWTVLQRAARKCTNGHKLPSESSSPKAAALGEKHIKLPQVRAVSSNRDFALMLPLSYNRIAFVPTWRLCIVEVHFMWVEPPKPRHPDPVGGDWSGAALWRERDIQASSQQRTAGTPGVLANIHGRVGGAE